MNLIQMFVVLLTLSLAMYLMLPIYGIDVTFQQVFLGLLAAKAISLFLLPEKPPMVLVRETQKEDD